MNLIIDGYNLMMQVGEFRMGEGSGALKHARASLLRKVAQALTQHQRHHTTIVFDAKAVPEGGVKTEIISDMTVYFAAGYAEADDLIEELIEVHKSPRNLTVVSSDRRLQLAAKRRSCVVMDAIGWWESLSKKAQNSRRSNSDAPALPSRSQRPAIGGEPAAAAHADPSAGPVGHKSDAPLAPPSLAPLTSYALTDEEVRRWIEIFGISSAAEIDQNSSLSELDHRHSTTSDDHAPPRGDEHLWDPFPPGYGLDILEQESDDEPPKS